MDLKQAHLRALDRIQMAPTPSATQRKRPATTPPVTIPTIPRTASIINMVAPRKKSNGRVVYDVVNFLQRIGRPVTAHEIFEDTGADVSTGSTLLEILKENSKISYDDGWFSYKPTYDIKNRDELSELISRAPNGIDSQELKDSYKTVHDDVKTLVEARKIIQIKNTDSNSDVLFPRDVRYDMELDNEFVDGWRGISIPDEVELEKRLLKAGLKRQDEVAEERQALKRAPQSKQKKQRKRRVKLTNIHVTNIDLSQDFTPEQLKKK